MDDIQRAIVETVKQGHNVFYTGPAGTGKSFVLREIINFFVEKYGGHDEFLQHVAVTAPTGIAAMNIGGSTIHSIAGCGVPVSVADFQKCCKKAFMWRNMKVLIMDEVSMLDPVFVDWLDVTVRQIRREPSKAFGGIQLVFSGDFCQLGPVPGCVSLNQTPIPLQTQKQKHISEMTLNKFIPVQLQLQAFAFQSAFWKDAQFQVFQLEKIYRQENIVFQNMLQQIRVGNLSSETCELIQNANRPINKASEQQQQQDIRPTILYCRNKQVDIENQAQFDLLPSQLSNVYPAIDSVKLLVQKHQVNATQRKLELQGHSFFRDCLAPKILQLKVGAQVMLLKNIKEYGLVNGSRGVVVRFVNDSISSSTTTTLFDHQQQQQQIAMMQNLPVVKFMDGHEQIIRPSLFENDVFQKGTCIRTQLPLRLAWACTVHKSQGLTLDHVIVDLDGCFAFGQAYVALSRARSLDKLQIRNFHQSTIKAHPLINRTTGQIDFESNSSLYWFHLIDTEWKEKVFKQNLIFKAWCLRD